jgi:hypothetical protein
MQSQLSEALTNMIEGGPYVCFRSHLRYANTRNDKIVETLGRLHNTLGLRALLLPIGRDVGLDDQIALHNIQEKMRATSSTVSDKAWNWEIMPVIARVSPEVAIPETTRKAKRSEHEELSHENFRKMANACALDWREPA